jgi:hypothetical protein
MMAGQQLKSAAVHWLLVNKRTDPGERRQTILCPARRCWEVTRRALRRLGQVAVEHSRLPEEQAMRDVEELIKDTGEAGDTVELSIGPVRRLLEANDLPLSPGQHSQITRGLSSLRTSDYEDPEFTVTLPMSSRI